MAYGFHAEMEAKYAQTARGMYTSCLALFAVLPLAAQVDSVLVMHGGLFRRPAPRTRSGGGVTAEALCVGSLEDLRTASSGAHTRVCSHCVSCVVSFTVSPSQSLAVSPAVSPSLCLPHCVSCCVSLTVSLPVCRRAGPGWAGCERAGVRRAVVGSYDAAGHAVRATRCAAGRCVGSMGVLHCRNAAPLSLSQTGGAAMQGERSARGGRAVRPGCDTTVSGTRPAQTLVLTLTVV
jgi:hypothetical protein